jgi:hypothetical protein
MKNLRKDQIVLYTNKNGKVELRADVNAETLLATQSQVAHLFEVDVRTVNEHLKNIFKTNELKEISVIRNFRITAKDGKQYLTKFYNLDAIIAVGYRINSKKATHFRIWATSILRQYLIRGFNLDQRKLAESKEGLDGLHETIAMIESEKHPGKLKGKVAIRLVKEFLP